MQSISDIIGIFGGLLGIVSFFKVSKKEKYQEDFQEFDDIFPRSERDKLNYTGEMSANIAEHIIQYMLEHDPDGYRAVDDIKNCPILYPDLQNIADKLKKTSVYRQFLMEILKRYEKYYYFICAGEYWRHCKSNDDKLVRTIRENIREYFLSYATLYNILNDIQHTKKEQRKLIKTLERVSKNLDADFFKINPQDFFKPIY